MLQKLNSTKLTIYAVLLDSIRGISCYFMMHLGMTKHRYKYWFFRGRNQINDMYMYVFAGGKLNQNAHITLRAPEDWQQLNLSVKNLVKELKTFDLPVRTMIPTVQRGKDIYGVVPFRCCCLVFTHALLLFFFKDARPHSDLLYLWV